MPACGCVCTTAMGGLALQVGDWHVMGHMPFWDGNTCIQNRPVSPAAGRQFNQCFRHNDFQHCVLSTKQKHWIKIEHPACLCIWNKPFVPYDEARETIENTKCVWQCHRHWLQLATYTELLISIEGLRCLQRTKADLEKTGCFFCRKETKTCKNA